MPANYVLLERIELNASAASVTFANIPQTGYTDLKIVASARKNQTAADVMNLYVNGNVVAISQNKYLDSGAGTPRSGTFTTYQGLMEPSDYTANTFSNTEIYIPNYNSTSQYKSISSDTVIENNATASYAGFTASLWPSNDAITTILLKSQAGDLVQYSTFSLYGLAAVGTTPAIAPKASGGNIIDYDGTYWYHTFLASGTFIPQTNLTCDYLVVAGGGGGGFGTGGGGGGAGGLRSTVTATGGGGSLETALSLISGTSYTATIGAGGAGLAQNPGAVSGNNGSNSVFSTITSTGGGGGGGENAAVKNGLTGGSGGGSNYLSGATAGSGTANQGYAGGVGSTNSTWYGGGGGGGAGAVGAANVTSTGGAGGAGIATSISGTSTSYAGGGGGGGQGSAGTQAFGGAGGSSIGGTGAGYLNNGAGISATNGVTNRGGGGGGGGAFTGGGSGSGGSGIVIVRYLA
jgi:hypothetical protein